MSIGDVETHIGRARNFAMNAKDEQARLALNELVAALTELTRIVKRDLL